LFSPTAPVLGKVKSDTFAAVCGRCFIYAVSEIPFHSEQIIPFHRAFSFSLPCAIIEYLDLAAQVVVHEGR